MKETLKKILKRHELVEIYTDAIEKEYFDVCYVTAISDNDVMLRTYNSVCEYDGYVLYPISEITEIRLGTRYLEGRGKIIASRQEQLTPFAIEGDLDGLGIDLFIAFLEECQKLHNLIKVTTVHDIELCGYVEELSENALILQQTDCDGFVDGKTIIPIDDLSKLDYDSKMLRARNSLALTHQ